MLFYRGICILVTAFMWLPALASDKLKWGGFISQSLIYSPENPLYSESTGWSADFRELGVNVSWQPVDRLRFAGQILSRRAGSLDDGSPRIDFALLDFNLTSIPHFDSGLRLGRIKIPFGIYNTVRDVPQGRPGVFVPRATYFDIFRDVILAVDGGELYFRSTGTWGDLEMQMLSGTSSIDEPTVEYQVFQADIPGEINRARGDIALLSVYPSVIPELQLLLSYIQTDMSLDQRQTFTEAEFFAAASILAVDPHRFPEFVTDIGLEIELTMLSAQYSWEKWLLTGEFLQGDVSVVDFEVLGSAQPGVESRLEAFYGQVEYLGVKDMSLYVRYGDIVYNKDDPKGLQYTFFTGNNPVTQYNKAWTFGGRWYLSPSLSVAGEYSHNHGAAFLSGPDNIDYQALKQRWQSLVFQVSYHF